MLLEINSIAFCIMDSKFAYPFSNRFTISEVAILSYPLNSKKNFGFCPNVFKLPEPLIEFISLLNYIYT